MYCRDFFVPLGVVSLVRMSVQARFWACAVHRLIFWRCNGCRMVFIDKGESLTEV